MLDVSAARSAFSFTSIRNDCVAMFIFLSLSFLSSRCRATWLSAFICALLMLLVTGWSLLWWWKRRLHDSGLLLATHVAMIPLGFVATLAGWISAEVGRQPWVVYGVLRTADAVSPVPVASVASSFALFVVVYNVLLAAYVYFLLRLVWGGSDDTVEPPVLTPQAAAIRATMPAE